jgi:hypothetical protein
MPIINGGTYDRINALFFVSSNVFDVAWNVRVAASRCEGTRDLRTTEVQSAP